MEKKENTGTKLNVLLCNLVDYVRGDDRPLVFAVMQEITEYFEQELDKAREEGKTEILKELERLAKYGAREFDGDEHSQLLNLCNAIYHLQKWGKNE